MNKIDKGCPKMSDKLATVEMYTCRGDEDLVWGYVYPGHDISLEEFYQQVKEYAYAPIKKPIERAWVHWKGFGGWQYCRPNDKGAKPVTIIADEIMSYSEWEADHGQ